MPSQGEMGLLFASESNLSVPVSVCGPTQGCVPVTPSFAISNLAGTQNANWWKWKHLEVADQSMRTLSQGQYTGIVAAGRPPPHMTSCPHAACPDQARKMLRSAREFPRLSQELKKGTPVEAKARAVWAVVFGGEEDGRGWAGVNGEDDRGTGWGLPKNGRCCYWSQSG